MFRAWHEAWQRLESVIGLCATFFVGYIPPVVLAFSTLANFGERMWWWGGLAAVGTVLACFVAASVTRMASTAFYQCYPEFGPARPDRFILSRLLKPTWPVDQVVLPGTPLAVAMAALLPPIPRLARPVLSLWWLGHFASGMVFGLFAYQVGDHAFANAQVAGKILAVVLPLVFHVGFLFAVNLYLLLAVAVYVRRPAIHEKLWRLRFLVDFVFTLVVLWLVVLR